MTTSSSLEAPSDSSGGALLCSKCEKNPRTARGSWCKACRNEYAAEWRGKNRPRERFEEGVVCALDGCDETFTWRSTHPGQKFHDRRCYIKDRNKTKKVEKRYLTPDAKMQRRRQEYKRKGYGITPEEFDQLVIDQRGCCVICMNERPLIPDHCHEKLVFRGAICNPCNLMLGKAFDNPLILERAAMYLRR